LPHGERLLLLQLSLPTEQPVSFLVRYEFEQYHGAGKRTLILVRR
jgi:hypothetical protein